MDSTDTLEAPAAPDAPDDDQSGGGPSELLDQVITALQSADESIDSAADPSSQQLEDLIDAALTVADELDSALNGTDESDPDPTAPDPADSADAANNPGDSADPGDPAEPTGPPEEDPKDLAAALDAALDAVMEQADGSPAQDALSQAETAVDSLLDAMGVTDPDDDAGVADSDPEAVAAAAGEIEVTPGGENGEVPDAQRFSFPVGVLEGVDTGDGRKIRTGGLSHRDLPLPVMAITKTTEGHKEAELVGRVDALERFDASKLINPKTKEPYGEGVFGWKGSGEFTSLENAEQVAGLIKNRFLRGVSADLADVSTELVAAEQPEGEMADKDKPVASGPDDLIKMLFDKPGSEEIASARMMGFTICPFQAFEGAFVQMGDGEIATDPTDLDDGEALAAGGHRERWPALNIVDEFGARSCLPCEQGLVASGGPMYPPKTWFQNPQLDEITPLTITDDGRIYGHLAPWSQCHTGVNGRCQLAPRSRMDYGMFHTGALKTAEGDVISVGNITMQTGHAQMTAGMAEAMAHYDNTGTGAADVCMGEDRHGIWFSGAVRPDLSELQVRQLRSSGLSGDWRLHGGSLELMAALAVNVQGFPIARARVASGAYQAMVAAGGRDVLEAAVDQAQTDGTTLTESWVAEMVEERVDALRARVLEPQLARARQRMMNREAAQLSIRMGRRAASFGWDPNLHPHGRGGKWAAKGGGGGSDNKPGSVDHDSGAVGKSNSPLPLWHGGPGKGAARGGEKVGTLKRGQMIDVGGHPQAPDKDMVDRVESQGDHTIVHTTDGRHIKVPSSTAVTKGAGGAIQIPGGPGPRQGEQPAIDSKGGALNLAGMHYLADRHTPAKAAKDSNIPVPDGAKVEKHPEGISVNGTVYRPAGGKIKAKWAQKGGSGKADNAPGSVSNDSGAAGKAGKTTGAVPQGNDLGSVIDRMLHAGTDKEGVMKPTYGRGSADAKKRAADKPLGDVGRTLAKVGEKEESNPLNALGRMARSGRDTREGDPVHFLKEGDKIEIPHPTIPGKTKTVRVNDLKIKGNMLHVHYKDSNSPDGYASVTTPMGGSLQKGSRGFVLP